MVVVGGGGALFYLQKKRLGKGISSLYLLPLCGRR